MTGFSPFKDIKQLNLTLRLPLTFFERLDSAEGAASAVDTTSTPDKTETWSILPAVLAELKSLSQFWLRLDHEDCACWAVVNERAVLRCLTTFLAESSLRTVIFLPKLHPMFEREDRHFLNEPASFKLYRAMRQRWRVRLDDYGRIDIFYTGDFPFLTEIGDLAEMPMKKLEEYERDMWRDGEDPEEWVQAELNRFCTLNI